MRPRVADAEAYKTEQESTRAVLTCGQDMPGAAFVPASAHRRVPGVRIPNSGH